MNESAQVLMTLGGLFLLGLLTDELGRRTPLPRVTLLLVFGFLIGPSAFRLLPSTGTAWFPPVANMALIMVGFLLGEKMNISALREYGRSVLCISVTLVVATAVIMLVVLVLLGFPLEIALLLAGIAPATAPAATADVVREYGADGPFSRTLLGIVALDDAWGLIVFSLLLSVVDILNGNGGGEMLLLGAWELCGALLLGGILGIPMAFLSGRIQPGEPTLVEALGIVFLCGGLALWFEVSFLLAAMALGVTVSNLARHHTRPFHAIEGIEWPFMILFFVLAGASLQVGALPRIGLLGLVYIILRILGRFAGVWIGARIGRSGPLVRRWMAPALMPQAGVAMGMALVAAQRFPETGEIILPVVIGATIFFELIGPVFTRQALVRAGEVLK